MSTRAIGSGESGESGERGDSGESGESGEGLRSGATFTTARALITNREGVVGPFYGPPFYLTNYPLPAPASLWSEPVRLRIFEAEMLSGIYYDGGTRSISVEYQGRAARTCDTLIHIIRP